MMLTVPQSDSPVAKLSRWSGRSTDTVLSLYVPAFVLATGVGIAIPALPLYAKSFEIDFGMASLVVIVHQLGATVSTVPTGYLIDRVGGRRMALLGPLLAALSSLMMAIAHSFPELLVYRFIEGWAMQMWMLGRLDLITGEGGNRRGTQITGMFSLDAAGRLVGPAIGGFVAAAWGLKAPFVLYAIVAFFAALPSFFFLPTSNRASQPASSRQKDSRAGWATMSEILTWPLIILLIGQFLASMTRGSLFSGTLDLYTVYAYGIGPETLGLLAAVSGALGLPLTWVSGRMMDRFGRRSTIVPGFTLLALAITSLAAAAYARWSFAGYVAAFLAAKLTMSSTSGSMQVVSSDVAPPHARGTFFGLWGLIGQVGLLLSPVFFALVSQYVSYGTAFASLSAMSACTAFIMWRQIRGISMHKVDALVPSPAVAGKG